MKFGKTFLSHQIPEWSIFYMNYKNLKKTIKNIDYDFNPEEMEVSDLMNSILSQFFYQLDRNIEKVDQFYNGKFNEYHRRLSKIITLLEVKEGKIHHQIDSDEELDEIISILLELKNVFRNLKWFGELNHKGFVKILKKLDKKMVSLSEMSNNHLENQLINLPSNNKENYLSTRVDALPFANEADLMNDLEVINTILNQLSLSEYTFKEGSPKIDHAKTRRSFSADVKAAGVPAIKGQSLPDTFDNLFLTNFIDIVDSDSSNDLLEELKKIPTPKKNLKFLLSLLVKATLKVSINCIDTLFTVLTDHLRENNLSTDNLMFDKFDINGRNFFHHISLQLGKRQAKKEQNPEKLLIPGENSNLNRLYGSSGSDGDKLHPINLDGLNYILDKINDNHEFYNLRFLLNAKDNYLRTPLHYASQYGIKDVARIVLQFLNKWSLISNSLSIDDAKFWGDQENLTPIHLAIIGKHPKTTQNLLVYSNTSKLQCSNLILLSVRLNCPEILEYLIKLGKIDINYTDYEHNNETALYIASKLNLEEVVEFLLSNNANTELGEMIFGWTPIFVAASDGFRKVVELLLEFHCKYDCVDDSGWLPMEHASLRGHLRVADLLKPANEKLLLYDIKNPVNNMQRVPNTTLQSQSPTISALQEDPSLMSSTSSVDVLPEPNKNAVNEVYKQLKQFDNTSSFSLDSRQRSKSPLNVKRIKPVKSFGHRYLNDDETLVLITLGTTDLRDNHKPIELNNISLDKNFITELDTALSLVITCRNKADNEAVEPPVVIDLPLEDHHGSATDPLTFKLTNNLNKNDIFMTFDIVPTYQSNIQDVNMPFSKNDQILGRAVALLDDAYTNVGPKLRSLHSVISSPIIESQSLSVLGVVRFEFLSVNSFTHKNLKLNRSDTYWKQLVSTRVIGHRGLGKNMSNKKSLQLGENTVESFIAAASLGASYVEFDVQLTKDSVPVIYHDFLVAESGVDIPMHTLTSEQFLHLNDNFEQYPGEKSFFDLPNSSSQSLLDTSTNGDSGGATKSDSGNTSASASMFAPSPLSQGSGTPFAYDDEILSKVHRPRSISAYKSAPNMAKNHHHHHHHRGDYESDDEIDREFHHQISRRMKLTKTWKDKGFKGNARGLSIASNFVTLKELFKKLPKKVGFNIEIKYPMLDEAQKESIGEIAYDMNHYVDTILQVVYDENLTGRDIIFSSFHPDICVLLSLKQPTIPILFLTEAGSNDMADIRASSLQNAIRFAKKWNLLGIVSAAETLVKTPRLAQVVKSSGLVCVTYGVLNNSPQNCKIQMRAGVDAVIADSVLAVRTGLRKDKQKGQDDDFYDDDEDEEEEEELDDAEAEEDETDS